jgi:hypothetical protein
MTMLQRFKESLSFHEELESYSRWITTKAATTKAFFMSVTFGVARDRYLINSHDDRSPTRHEVASGLTRQMPLDQALEAQIGDVRRWYLRLLRELIGKRYGSYPELQPTAIGWLDEPALKHFDNDNVRRRLVGQKFPNGHFVMLVPDVMHPREGRMIDRFVRLYDDGTLDQLWRRFNPDGELHAMEAYDIPGAMDYAAKTAKRLSVYREHMIMLPFGASANSSKLIIGDNDNQR